jgi:hypothetical protein
VSPKASSVCLLFAACTAGAQQWVAVGLHPGSGPYSEVLAISAHRQGGYYDPPPPALGQAGIWSGSAGSWLPLSPLSQSGEIRGMDDTTQVGYACGAALWHGTPESRVDLTPPSAWPSAADAVRGNMQVGVVTIGGVEHAALWRGTAASFVDLHPAGAVSSGAGATDGVLQGGEVYWPDQHATIWSGTAESAVDLYPSGRESALYGMAPGVQVGMVSMPSFHAAVWHGTAASFQDFNPPGGSTRFFATTGRIHVGQGGLGLPGAAHAILNFGSPGAWLDLHQFLPPGYNSYSAANAVCQDGARIYVGGYAVSNATQNNEAFMWIGTVPCYANCDASTTPPALNVGDFSCFLNRFATGDGYANCDQSTTPPVLNVADFSCFLNAFAAGCS